MHPSYPASYFSYFCTYFTILIIFVNSCCVRVTYFWMSVSIKLDLFPTLCSIIKANLNCLSVHWFGPTDGHPSSSDPSSQSGIPSHLYDSWMHCFRLLHLNWDPEQVIGGQSFSSALSKQSLSPSQRHDCGMQLPELSQVNWGEGKMMLKQILRKKMENRRRDTPHNDTQYMALVLLFWVSFVPLVVRYNRLAWGLTH